MITNHIAKITATAIAAFALAGFAATATASASTVDDQFLTNISAEGITFTSANAALGEAQKVCHYLAAGETGVTLTTAIQNNTDLTTDQAAAFVVDSTYAYCPSLKGQLQA